MHVLRDLQGNIGGKAQREKSLLILNGFPLQLDLIISDSDMLFPFKRVEP